MSAARSISSSEIVSGGAIRMQFGAPPLPPRTRLIDSPRSSHSAVSAGPSACAGLRVSRSSTSSSPHSSPRPRTSPIASWRDCNSRRWPISRPPARSARPGRSSSRTTSSTASAAAAGSGSDTCDVTCMKPRAWHSSSILALVTTAPTGTPPPSVFESTRKSGTIP